MIPALNANAQFRSELPPTPVPRLQVELADSPKDIEAVQRLRYQVFVEEMGARIETIEAGVERDHFDPFCEHLIVRDIEVNRIVGCYRILTSTQVEKAGGYYSAGEFDLTRILSLPGRLMEVGRTCVHPDYRTGATIALLWQGLARYMVKNRFDYLMGCASIPLGHGTGAAQALYDHLKDNYLAPEQWRVVPKVRLPQVNLVGDQEGGAIPPLLKAYLRVGARICGEPAWDPQFNVADLFILLRADQMKTRYVRHFVNR